MNKTVSKPRVLFGVCLILISVIIMTYPVAATLWNNHKLHTIADAYEDKVVAEASEEENERILAAGDAYNANLQRYPFSPPPIGQELGHEHYGEYLEQLPSPNGEIGVITIPSIGVKLPIFHGSTDETLYKGAGHLYGTQLPLGGQGYTSVISAHTGMVNASMFDNLPKMEPGDIAIVQVRNRRIAYTMKTSEVVSSESTDAVPQDERDLLVLITCTPYGLNTDRLLVTLERTELPPDTDTAQITPSLASTWQWWMTVVIVAGTTFILIAAWNLRQLFKPRPKHAKLKSQS